MLKGPKDYFKEGDWNAFCDVCGFKYKASELRKRWDGMMVCSRDYEERHPQDFIRGIRETPAPPFSRPRNDGPSPIIPFTENDTPVGFPPGKTTPLAGEADQAGSPYFIPFGPVDKSKL